MNKNIIELRGISKKINTCHILSNINIFIQHGEFLTLLGPSGCGKTSLLRIISGFDKPDTGRVIINGYDSTDLPPEKRHLNMVFQSYALFPHMTVYDNIAFGLKCKKIPENEIEFRVKNVLRMVKLENLAKRKPNQLSGGQQQRVAIARAVINEPVVLLLDEPLSALDYNLRKSMRIELKQLQRRLGITFIFVTHDQEEALSMSDRIIIMKEGQIKQIGTPRDIYEEPSCLYVAKFVGEINIFDTEIIEISVEGKLIIEIENKIFLLNNKQNLKRYNKIYVIMRPEDFIVYGGEDITTEDKKDLIEGIIEQVIYKGSTVDLIIRLQSNKKILATKFFNEDDETLDYYTTERVWIDWIPGWEVILPYENKI